MLLLVLMADACIYTAVLLVVYIQIDFSEEAGRNRLITLLRSLLANLDMPSDFVEASMRALAAANPTKVLCLQYMDCTCVINNSL
jgi:Ni,Fe-hydrogenase I small subunit